MRALVLVALMGCASAMHRVAQVTEVTAYGAMACDYGSTSAALSNPKYYETNMVLGDHPDGATLTSYYALIESDIWFANRVLPDWARVAINATVTAIGFRSDLRNAGLGVTHCGL
jgi:hypothetical protein